MWVQYQYKQMHSSNLDVVLWQGILQHEICTILGYYVASCGNHLLTFRDSVSVPPSRARSWPFKTGAIHCPEMLVNDYCMMPHNIAEERRSHQHRNGNLKWRSSNIFQALTWPSSGRYRQEYNCSSKVLEPFLYLTWSYDQSINSKLKDNYKNKF
jgi:hypothetical protein